jgi:3-dehydroquinate synthase II
MKTAWVRVDPWDKSLVTTALEGGAAAVMVPEGYHQKVKELGRITTIAPDGDLKPEKEVVFYEVKSQEDEKEILRLAHSTTVGSYCLRARSRRDIDQDRRSGGTQENSGHRARTG